MRRMNKFNHYSDLSEADKWFTRFMLGCSAPTSERLLTSTRLTDLIYQSMSFEDVYYGNQRPEYPVNTEKWQWKKFSSLQKQKKSSIFRTVICPILDCCWQRVPPNYLQYKRLDCSYGGFANRSQRRETKIFTNKTHKKQQTNF